VCVCWWWWWWWMLWHIFEFDRLMRNAGRDAGEGIRAGLVAPSSSTLSNSNACTNVVVHYDAARCTGSSCLTVVALSDPTDSEECNDNPWREILLFARSPGFVLEGLFWRNMIELSLNCIIWMDKVLK